MNTEFGAPGASFPEIIIGILFLGGRKREGSVGTGRLPASQGSSCSSRLGLLCSPGTPVTLTHCGRTDHARRTRAERRRELKETLSAPPLTYAAGPWVPICRMGLGTSTRCLPPQQAGDAAPDKPAVNCPRMWRSVTAPMGESLSA